MIGLKPHIDVETCWSSGINLWLIGNATATPPDALFYAPHGSPGCLHVAGKACTMTYYRVIWNGWTEMWEVERVEDSQVRHDETLFTNYFFAYRAALRLNAPYRDSATPGDPS